jgi:chromosome segregation ATPase
MERLAGELTRMQELISKRLDDLHGIIDSLVEDQRSARNALLEIQRSLEIQQSENEKQALKIELVENQLGRLSEKLTQLEKSVSELKAVPLKRDAEITQTVKKWIIGAVGASVTAAVMAAIAKIAGLIK